MRMLIEDCEKISEHNTVSLYKHPNGGYMFLVKNPQFPNNTWDAYVLKLEDWEFAAECLVESITQSAKHSCMMLYMGEAQK